MKIKITDKASGLKPGSTYDLCEMSAIGLINKNQAVSAEKPAPPKPSSAVKKDDKKATVRLAEDGKPK